jgi:phosphoribosylamine--glycine ligase
MKILVIDFNELAVHMCQKFQDEGHDVTLYVPPHKDGTPSVSGTGIVNKVLDWRKVIHKVDMTVLTDNASYQAELEPLFQAGYPIIGANQKSAALELDREHGQRVLEQYGITVANNKVFDDYDKAAQYVKKNAKKVFVSKPWGGTEDKDLSYVSKSAADMIFMLEQWKLRGKLKGEFMLQECIDGYEMAVGGWFGPGGWSKYINENWEEKRQMNDGLGQNTGERGTVMRYVKQSALFDETLEPVTDYLTECGYVGYVDMNCIIDKKGKPWPLEFTMRFGWPHINIAMALHKGDQAKWLYDLWQGKDTMKVSSDVSAGVVMVRPNKDKAHAPIYGITNKNIDQLCFERIVEEKAPMMVDGEVEEVSTYCTVDEHEVLTVTGTGSTVSEATEKAYKAVWEINWPGNREFRTDIGKHLEEHLPKLQEFGYATGMEY